MKPLTLLVIATLTTTLTLTSCAGTGTSNSTSNTANKTVSTQLSEKSTTQEIANALTGTWVGCSSKRNILTNISVAPSMLMKSTIKVDVTKNEITATDNSVTEYPESADCTGKAGQTMTNEDDSDEFTIAALKKGTQPFAEFPNGYLFFTDGVSDDTGIMISLDGKTIAYANIDDEKLIIDAIMKKQ